MKLSNKCRYGLRALVDLSTRTSQEYVVLATLASDNNISQQYLEQVFASLRRAGIVLGVKGAQGDINSIALHQKSKFQIFLLLWMESIRLSQRVHRLLGCRLQWRFKVW